jgi:uncharacterized membrane protein
VVSAATPVRGPRERVLQTLAFEAGGLLLVAPLVALAGVASGGGSLLLVAALSVVVMAWAALFNTAFDRIEARVARRVASERPHRWRTLHALLLEASSVVVSLPVIVALTSLGWWQALGLDLALTLVYAAYAYLFHLAYDRLRPVRSG